MDATFEALTTYLVRTCPGLILGAAMLVLARRQPRLRIVIYVALFVLLRDAMTPLGLWSFGTEAFFWIRLSSDPGFLTIFGVACLGLSLGVYFLDRENQAIIEWTRGRLAVGMLLGVVGALVVVAPLVAVYQRTR